MSVLELAREEAQRPPSAPFWFEVEHDPVIAGLERAIAMVQALPEPSVVVDPEPRWLATVSEPEPRWMATFAEPDAEDPAEPRFAFGPVPEIEEPPAPEWGWHESWTFEVQAESPQPAPRARPGRLRRSIDKRHPIVAVAVLSLLAGVLLVMPRSLSANAPLSRPALALFPRPSVYARRTIPPRYLALYWRAAQEYGLDWTKLAAIGEVESDHGRSRLPGVTSGTNAAGAAGPAQFRASTWARYGVDVDGRGQIDQYDPADAITSMAAYLKAAGAPENWPLAIDTYNDSSQYVDQVLALSRRFVAAR